MKRARRVPRASELVFWDLVRKGWSTVDASGVAGFDPAHGQRLLTHNGGMVPNLVQTLKPRFLAIQEREEIYAGVVRGDSIRQIARDIGRSPSTVKRELDRNRGGGRAYRGANSRGKARSAFKYSPSLAQRRFETRLARPKASKMELNPVLAARVLLRLRSGHSPVQIMQRLRMDFPTDPTMRISHEAIYRSIYVQGKGQLRAELAKCLRTGRAQRVPRAQLQRRKAQRNQGKIPNMVNISQRPAEVADRAVPGHWEGDLILGKNGASQIGTLVERTSRFVILLHLPGRRDAATVAEEMINQMRQLHAQLRLSITWDQGKEMANHADIKTALDLRDGIYFCDPHSPWQRGTNENTNGLLRQYFPKGSDLKEYDRNYLNAVAAELNNRPRKTLQWHTPAEVLSKILNNKENPGVATIP